MAGSRNGSNRTVSDRKPTQYVVLQRHEDEERGVYYTERGTQETVNDAKAVSLTEEANRGGSESLHHGDECYAIPDRYWHKRTIVIEETTSYSVR